MTVDNGNSILQNRTFATEQKLSTFELCTDDIIRIIKLLDSNKAHGHDEISFRFIKVCVSSVESKLVTENFVFIQNYFD